MKVLLAGALLVLALSGLIAVRKSDHSVLRSVRQLKVRITANTSVPDPAKIESAGDWYYADHVSSGLVSYENESKKFVPLYSTEWNVSADGTHIFKLRSSSRFHDGTIITARDVLWSLKRLLILKTSSHFPLWEYVVGCENLKSLEDKCVGLTADDSEIRVKLKTLNDSFFLQLASPETGIWSADDMDPRSLKLTPTKFSGPYYVKKVTNSETLLIRNPNSPISQKFLFSPQEIILKGLPTNQIDVALQNHSIDLAVRSYRPFSTIDFSHSGLNIQNTTPSSIIYFQGTGANREIGKDLVQAIWSLNSDQLLIPADSFLPFSKTTAITKSEFLSSLPRSSSKVIRVLCPDGFFTNGMLQLLSTAAQSVGSLIEFSFLPSKDWFAAFEDKNSKDKYDFILSSYAASERYPAVQLRYITSPLVKAPIDLKPAESPDLDNNKVEILKSYERWLLEKQVAIPLFFNVTQFIYSKNLDLGEQSLTDAEIELWRIREKNSL